MSLFRKANIATQSYRRLLQCANCNAVRAISDDGPTSRASSDLYDVVISGGGMVGTAMAACLGNNPLFEDKRILLLEAGPSKPFGALPKEYSNRTCALSPATVKLLNSFGAWESICDMRCQEVKRMQVWDCASDSMIAFNRKDLMDDLAYIVENDVILAAINTQMERLKDCVEIRYGHKVKSYRLPLPGAMKTKDDADSTFVGMELDSGEQIATRLLIGADGFKSLVRKTADIHTVGWDYNQFGVVATLHITETPDNNVAWQRFLKTGPIAMLPLDSRNSCLIWSTSPSEAENLLKLDSESFVDAVNSAFWSDDTKHPIANYVNRTFDDLLSNFGRSSRSIQQLPPTVVNIADNSRARFPLGLSHASQYVKTRVALIGDAAHRVHPMAGQGVNLGFADVECLVNELGQAVSNGQDIGALNHLLRFETQRQRAVVPVMALTDGLVRLYSTDWTPFVLARTLGLQATNAVEPLKNRLMQQAMG